MSIKLYIPGSLSRAAQGKKMLELDGRTVGECLEHLVTLLPKMGEAIFYESKWAFALRSHIEVLVNKESVNAEILAKEVNDGDEIRLKKKAQ